MKYSLLLSSAVLLAGCLFVSCVSDKDFLTEKPKAVLTVENGFNTSDQVFNTLVSAYNGLEGFHFTTGTSPREMIFYKMTGTDLLDMNGRNGRMSNFTTWSPLAAWVSGMWDQYYKVISYCNLALSQIDNVSWSSEQERHYVEAEAHFLRGFCYMKLASYYGGIPLQKEFSENPRFDYVRETRADSFLYAIEEMKLAYETLPDYPVQNGRVGKGAAALFLSQAYLALGVETSDSSYYGNAASMAEAVIKLHPMMTSRFGERTASATGTKNGVDVAVPDGNVYFDLFVPSNVVNPVNTEAVWVMMGTPDYATQGTVGGKRMSTVPTAPALQDMNWDPQYLVEGASDGPFKSVSAKYGSKTNPPIHGGLGWGNAPNTWYASVDMWDAVHNNNSEEDYRYKEGITVRTKYLVCDPKHPMYEQYAGWEHINKSDELACSKYFTIFYKISPMDAYDMDEAEPGMMGGSRSNQYRNVYAARSAEAYLLLAEAKLRQGNTTDALNALNAVRIRSNANPMSEITLNTILDERGRELIFEEDRWATFLRMEPEIWRQRIYDYGMYTATDGRVYPEIRRWSEYTEKITFKYWPIPQTYIDLNTGADFPQNEGWK